ncbi:hypothetical protein RND81_11G236200 [Saponaria officinalis]|uniref:Uncharacterized protein n=1 Tax=Saponaria officinalis TaxID=3572 RepID=A0AAW1HRU1_SAPOF
MEGKASKSCCPTPAASSGGSTPPNSKACCKCGPGWKCEIWKIEPATETKPFYNCADSCVCVEGLSTGKETVVETDGAYCVCGEGYACTITKTDGPDAGKVFCECGNGYSCEITPSGDKVVFKDA